MIGRLHVYVQLYYTITDKIKIHEIHIFKGRVKNRIGYYIDSRVRFIFVWQQTALISVD